MGRDRAQTAARQLSVVWPKKLSCNLDVIYIVGLLLGIVLPLYFVGLASLGTSFGVFFSVLFAVMYGFCLREMK